MTLSWIKCKGDKWCPLNTVDLSSEHFDGKEGVYIIWRGGENAATIRVGQGVIRDRLKAHRDDPEIQDFESLYVTWATVSAADMDGVEAFLGQRLKPLVGERFPDVDPIVVDLPW